MILFVFLELNRITVLILLQKGCNINVAKAFQLHLLEESESLALVLPAQSVLISNFSGFFFKLVNKMSLLTRANKGK